MKALVTGADGFIGSHLTEMLVKNNFKVRALSQYNSFNNWGWLEDIECLDDIEVISGDIRDLSFCRSLTKNIDVVFHLAALIGIPYSYTAPDSYLETNIRGTMNMCHAVMDSSVQQLIYTSTSEVYGTALYIPIDEKHPLQPQSPYSASKIAADAMAMSFFNAYDLPLTIARPFNTYGPRQSARAVIPNIIAQIASGIKKIKLGSVSPTRDFNYVEDTCNGFISLVNKNSTTGEVYNIGSNSEVSILEVFNLIKELMDSDVEIFKEEERIRPENSEVQRLVCDNTKIKNATGYKQSVDLEQGLKKTIDWLSIDKNLEKYKISIFNV
tara:strand:- start:55649 stop:56626 length:978 start_codon:yes stop_codon:yes gene_type:complete